MLEDLPEKYFAAIHADVPWSFKARTPAGEGRSAKRHYPTMTFAEIKMLPVRRIAARDSHLFFWTTQPFLEHAFEIMRRWGFRYSSIAFTWIKLKSGSDPSQFSPLHLVEEDLFTGLGLTTRKNSEICLLGRRGSPIRLSKSVREIILAPVREHSRKPDETYDRIMTYCCGPYLDLFGRQRRKGWTVFGNEVDKFPEDSPCAPIATAGGTETPFSLT
jgi:N6-adenosine-specific RNA methylase IME4